MDCGYCFGPEKMPDISTREALDKIDEFKNQGIKRIVFTGGEPLLRSDIVELVQKTHKAGIYTVLHTNGILLTEDIINQLEDSLDQINLPLDGYNEDTNKKLRPIGHFDLVMKHLDYLKDKDIKVTVSTVACPQNKDYIEKIAEALPAYIDKWRIFQFAAVGKARPVKQEFNLSDDEFNRIVEKIKKLEAPFKVQFIYNNDDEFTKSYRIVD